MVDGATGEKHVLAGEVPGVLLDHWKQQVGEQLICQIELYAMVAVRWQWRKLIAQRRVIWFVDNEAARFSAIKGISATTTMRALVREFFSFEAESPRLSLTLKGCPVHPILQMAHRAKLLKKSWLCWVLTLAVFLSIQQSSFHACSNPAGL